MEGFTEFLVKRFNNCFVYQPKIGVHDKNDNVSIICTINIATLMQSPADFVCIFCVNLRDLREIIGLCQNCRTPKNW